MLLVGVRATGPLLRRVAGLSRTLNLMPSASDHISWTYTTSFLPNDLLRGSLWDRPGIVAEMFTFLAVHNGPSCHDITHGGGKKKGV